MSVYSDYASAHAIALEGTRTARVRAMAEMRRPAAQYKETCTFHEVAAVALWVDPDCGYIAPLCDEHLRANLEVYVRETDSYPPVIVPLKRIG